MRFDPSQSAAPGAVELSGSLWAALARAVGEFHGAFAENKRFSSHFAHGLEKPLRKTVMTLIDSQPQTANEVVNAHYAFELKTPGFDKGKAIARFLTCPPFRGRTPIFVGDDEADEAGFAVVSGAGALLFRSGGRARARLAPSRARAKCVNGSPISLNPETGHDP